MNPAQIEATEHADAHTQNAALPTYSALFALAQRLAYPDGGELLILEDYRNMARNIVQPNGVRIDLCRPHDYPKHNAR